MAASSPSFTFEIESYGCIRQMTLPVGGMHALIGPNDSGKSTVLRALRTVLQFAGDGFDMGVRPCRPFDPMFDEGVPTQLTLIHPDGSYGVKWDGHATTDLWSTPDGKTTETSRSWNSCASLPDGVRDRFRPPFLVRLSADALRRPSQLIPDDIPIRFDSETGHGLAGVYDRISSQHPEDYLAIRDKLRKKSSSVKGMVLANVGSNRKRLDVELVDGRRIPADAVSEGLLYYLAFESLRYLERPGALLVEEPENGLHPARIAEVMKLLREYSEHTPVLLATHSPLVVNELEPDEVSVLTRTPATGTVRRLLRETPNFEERSRIYALGELWISYADGDEEAPLFAQTVEPSDPGEPVEHSSPES